MAISITNQPTSNNIVSTLIPIVIEVNETTSNTTNIIATCYWIDQTTSTTNQIGAKYRMAPDINNVDNFLFDSSEIFNTITKYTLNDAPNNWKLGADTTNLNYQIWEDIATWKVRVKFQREYLDSTTGLIVLDPTLVDSNLFYVHEGSPEQKWLTQITDTNGNSNSVFDQFLLSYQTDNTKRRFLTNYPIDNTQYSTINIHESEQYILNFFANNSVYSGYKINFITADLGGGLLNVHEIILSESSNLATLTCGFRDLINSFTPIATEGTGFSNVGVYFVNILCSNTPATPAVYVNATTSLKFIVDRTCIKNVGYLRFCFKNMLGGFDMVTSRGKFDKSIENSFNQFEKSLGYYSWSESMSFGKSNWANNNIEKYEVMTKPMKPNDALYFSEMFSSTQVYLREKNDSNLKINSSIENEASRIFPYKFVPIKITSGTQSILDTSENLVVLKFSFTKAVNQRNPRY